MAAKSKSRKPRSQKPSSNDITERVRQRAYDLYVQRGRVDGFDLDDWFRAESEIRGTKKFGSEAKQIQERL